MTSPPPVSQPQTTDRDRSEFVKFCKFFTIRTIQILVQSRSGRKTRTQSRVVCQPTDWFNVNVDELAEINEELKRNLRGHYLSPESTSVNLLISLRTTDGETLELEVWRLGLDREQCDAGVSVRSHLYHRMSVLLRSAVCASRVTPTYKLYARRQGRDTFILRYQFSCGPLDLNILGEGAKNVDLGFVASPFGAIRMSVHYRTKMVISDSCSESLGLKTSIRENYYASASEPTFNKITAATNVHRDLADLPWAPLTEPAGLKALPPLPDFSPCFSTFSTSPLSGDFFPFSPSPARRPSVAFQLGATSCSSSEEGSSCHGPSSVTTTTAGALVPFSGPLAEAKNIPTRSSSGTLFKLDLSSGSPKPSSFPAGQSGNRASAPYTAFRDTFPFAHLLTSCSAPNFGGQIVFGQHQLSLTPAASAASSGAFGAHTKVARRRITVAAVAEEGSGSHAAPGSEENLESSREVMVSDGVKIVEKRRSRKGKKKSHHHHKRKSEDGEEIAEKKEDGDEENESCSSSSSSSGDDSYVRYEMRPVFANGTDLGAFFSQCKAAPVQLKSFTPDVVQEEPAAARISESAPRHSLEEIPEQLKLFEEKQKFFDDFLKSLKVDESASDEEQQSEPEKDKNQLTD